MRKLLQSWLVSFTLLAFVWQSSLAWAETGARGRVSSVLDEAQETRAAEFVMRRYPGEKLMPVRILGGVQRPGTYYLPEGTDLLTAIALSGGLAPNADSEEIRWNQWSTQKYSTLALEDAMISPKERNPALGANDVLMVEEKTPLLSNNTLLLLTALSSIVGIVVGAVYVSRDK